MIKPEYGLGVIMQSKCICDPVTQHVNWEYELPGVANKCSYRNMFHCQTALQSRQQHHLLCRNGAAKSSDSLAIKILPRRINCNSLFIAYHLSICLCEHKLEIPPPSTLKPFHCHSLSSHTTNQLFTNDTDTLLVLTMTAATDKSW